MDILYTYNIIFSINIHDEHTIQVHEHITKLQEISEFGSKEYSLERSLAQMESEWKPLLFEVQKPIMHYFY